ncbi:MAG: Type II/IV secretion system protein TadC, associated with Flp pilus assembly [uncultured Paraburkholderia sp.]|nr:MAG: Type II/IV secretion system protein TadC, associated with Flp pilus assembly [uncultured Paraburkholderia sp.]
MLWCACVAISDYRSRRISNALVITGLIAAFLCALLDMGPFGLSAAQAAAGAAVGLVALLPFFAFGVMGAADVKVFAVLGAWCGMHALIGLWAVASVVAGLHALCVLVATRTHVAALLARRAPTFEFAGRRATPFAACLTVPLMVWLAAQIAAQILAGGGPMSTPWQAADNKPRTSPHAKSRPFRRAGRTQRAATPRSSSRPLFFCVFYALVTFCLIFVAQQSLTLASEEGARAALNYQKANDVTAAINLRETRRAMLRERIGRMAVKMTGVMILTLLPALMIVTAGPGVLSVSHSLKAMHR